MHLGVQARDKVQTQILISAMKSQVPNSQSTCHMSYDRGTCSQKLSIVRSRLISEEAKYKYLLMVRYKREEKQKHKQCYSVICVLVRN